MNLWNISNEGHFIDKKTFVNLDYQMSLPKPTLYDERVQFDFQFKFRPGCKNQRVLLVAASITDRFGKQYQKYFCQVLDKEKKIQVSIPVDKLLSVSNSSVLFIYLSESGEKSIVSYHFEKNGKNATLYQVERCQMTDEEKTYFIGSSGVMVG